MRASIARTIATATTATTSSPPTAHTSTTTKAPAKTTETTASAPSNSATILYVDA